MNIIDYIKPENYATKWIVDNMNKECLFVDNSFQRRYVWLEKHQIKLIETILLGYVIPEIYIWNVDTNLETGDIKYSIVDGQQRIGAVVNFINGNFKLKKSFIEETEADYADKTFKELSDADKTKIWNYSFSFKRIGPEVSRDDIVKMFLRLNCTDKSLNPQELRNAEFNGLFLKNALEISGLEFWDKYKIFTIDGLRRMSDVEFISSLLIYLRRGIETEVTQKALNAAYDLYNEKYDEAKDDKAAIETMITILDAVAQKDDFIISYYRRSTHLYTIMVAVYSMFLIGGILSDKQMDNLIAFYKNYESDDEDLDIEYKEYKELMSEGTRSKANRMRRVQILKKAINGELNS